MFERQTFTKRVPVSLQITTGLNINMCSVQKTFEGEVPDGNSNVIAKKKKIHSLCAVCVFTVKSDRCRQEETHSLEGSGQRPRPLGSASHLMCLSVSGKIPALRRVPCGCGLGGRHSNVFVTQERGNCKRFLHNCAFVPLPGGSRASQASSETRLTQRCDAEVQEHSAEAGGGTTLNAAAKIFNDGTLKCVCKTLAKGTIIRLLFA